MTLLAADTSFGTSSISKFPSYSNSYASSVVKAKLDSMTAEDGPFAGVADVIVATDLSDVRVEGAKLYLLSTGEAQSLSAAERIMSFPLSDSYFNGSWWLRSPGNPNNTAYVFGDGTVYPNGNSTLKNFGVRPALRLDLSKVMFDAATNTFVYGGETVVTEPTITGADLALNGSLDFRFYVDIPAGIDTTGANMSFSIGGRSGRTSQNIPLTSAGTSTDTATMGQRIFSFPVYAIEMAEDVTAVFHYQAGGEDKTATLTTSIEKYLDKVEELNKDSNYYEKLAELITATRNYGHYMQPYLANVHNFKVDSYAAIKQGSEFTPLTDDEMTALSGFERKKNSEYDKSNIKSVGYFLTLNERTTLNILLGFNNEPGVISATANGEPATVNANPELNNPDGSSATGIYRLIEIPNIAANNLDMTYTVIVKDGETTVYDVNMSALSFVYAVLNANGTGDIEKQALTALYRYNVAADAYGSNG